MDKLEKDINEVVDKASEEIHMNHAKFMAKMVAEYIGQLAECGVIETQLVIALSTTFQTTKMHLSAQMQMMMMNGPADE